MVEEDGGNIRIYLMKKGDQKSSRIEQVKSNITVSTLFKLAKNKIKGKKWNLCELKNGVQITELNFQTYLEEDQVFIFSSVKIKDTQDKMEAGHEIEEEKIDNIQKKPTTIIKLFSKNTETDEEAELQLKSRAKLKGVISAFGMPDLHPGKGFPIGAALITENVIYPHLVGDDIGCGMSFIRTHIKITKQKAEKWSSQICSIDNKFEDIEQYKNMPLQWPRGVDVLPMNLIMDKYLEKLGTIGKGNHFAEIQEIDEILDEGKFLELELSENELYLTVHSGSRNFGNYVFEEFTQSKGITPLEENSDEFSKYYDLHNTACEYAKRNRALIAYRILSQIRGSKVQFRGAQITEHQIEGDTNLLDEEHKISTNMNYLEDDCILDIHHNNVERIITNEERVIYVHRKGAAPGNHGPIIVPGSRGDYSYLVAPSTSLEQLQSFGYSLPHGAGRKMNRSKSASVVKKLFPNASNLLITGLNSYVICESKQLLYEEAPHAYKDISTVIQDIEEFKMGIVIARLKPVLTYKYKGT